MDGNIWYVAALLITSLFSGVGGGWIMRRRKDNREDQQFQREEYQLIIAELREDHRLEKQRLRREIDKLSKAIDKARQEAEEDDAARLAEIVQLRERLAEAEQHG